MIPFGQDPPPESILGELWKCNGCGALTRTDERGDVPLDKCRCVGSQSGTFLGWLTKGGALIVWGEERQ